VVLISLYTNSSAVNMPLQVTKLEIVPSTPRKGEKMTTTVISTLSNNLNSTLTLSY
jgi:hypothetical protein